MIEPVRRPPRPRPPLLAWTASKIADELGYAPRVPFDEGLAATVAWYRDRRDWWEPSRR